MLEALSILHETQAAKPRAAPLASGEAGADWAPRPSGSEKVKAECLELVAY